MIIDAINCRILDELQRDATLSVAELSSRVGLSPTPCWKRVQKLQADGFIERRVALLNPSKLGLGIAAFVSVECASHEAKSIAAFNEAILGMPEVIGAYRMAGDVDYILNVVAEDMEAYDRFYSHLVQAVPLMKVISHFVMERVKSTTALPVTQIV